MMNDPYLIHLIAMQLDDPRTVKELFYHSGYCQLVKKNEAIYNQLFKKFGKRYWVEDLPDEIKPVLFDDINLDDHQDTCIYPEEYYYLAADLPVIMFQ